MPVISIQYDDDCPETYRSVAISNIINMELQVFDSGNFVKDWYNAQKCIIINQIMGVHLSSSVNHFIMDGAPYDSAYLDLGNNLAILRFPDESNTEEIEGMKFFVDRGKRPTWQELMDYCND